MIIVVTGPTGVGKTKLSIKLAKHFNAEIINADSMQFYQGLDIGTAKVKEEEKEGIVHHLFDILTVDEMFTIYDYQKLGRKLLSDLKEKNKNIIIVGGSILYIKALLYNYELNENKQTYDFSSLSNEDLLKEILKQDPACDIHINNRKRLERYATILLSGDKHNDKADEKLYDFIGIGLTTERKNLYENINKRVDLMFEEGLLEEVKAFYDQKLKSKALITGIGYKELYPYFDGLISLEQAKDNIKKNSRRYAKKQYTFINNQMDIKWYETNYDDFDETVKEVINDIKEIS